MEVSPSNQHVQNLEKKLLPAVFAKTPKKKAFLQRDIPMRQPGLQI